MPSEALLDAVAKARHDLGRYVAFQVRSLEPGASDADLRLALDADLNHTRSTPDATCAQVWAGLRAAVVAAGLVAPEVEAVDATVAELQRRALALASLGTPALWETVDLAIGLGERLRSLHRAMLAEQAEAK